MIHIQVINRDGVQREIESEPDRSLMEALRDAEFDELAAICGGCCSCATCHVYIEEGPAAILTPPSPDEDDLLESSSYRQTNSRLSCQVLLSDELDEIVVRIAPSE